MVCPFVAGIGRAGASQFVSSFAASNEGALTPEPWKARFLVAEGSRSNQKATQKILNLTFDPRTFKTEPVKALYNLGFDVRPVATVDDAGLLWVTC